MKRENSVICTYGTGIGGMEVLFKGYVTYLLDNEFNVYFITLNDSKNIYHSLLPQNDNLHYIYRDSSNIMYMSEGCRQKQRQNVLSQIGDVDCSHTFCIGGYFIDILVLMNIFKDKSVNISMIWPHPLDWSTFIPLTRTQYFYKKNTCSSLYKYQKALFKEMDKKHASFYTSYAIFDFNNWYYDANLSKRKIEGLPIQLEVGNEFTYHCESDKKDWNVLWVGRFDFYKNDAICKVFEALESLAKQDESLRITFNIAGHGNYVYEENLKSRITPNFIKVNYLGTIQPNKLNDVFSLNDIGIAMGVTVKQMGYSGLPSILVDSLSADYKGENICNWVFDIATGDDGDGLYYQLMGKPLNYRRTLVETFSEVFNNPEILNCYSEKCHDYVKENYSYDKQYKILTERARSSKFLSNSSFPIYRYSLIRRIIRLMVYLLRSLNK